MKKKNWIKKACCVFLSLCMVLGMVLNYLPTVSRASGNYTEYTFSDLKFDEETSFVEVEKQLPVQSLDSIAFRGKITYQTVDPEPWNDRLYIGSTQGGWNGFWVYYRSADNVIVVNDSATYSLNAVGENLIGMPLEYYITFDVNGTQATAGISVNGEKIADYEFSSSNIPGNYIMLYSKNQNMKIESVSTEELPTYTEVTFASCGFTPGEEFTEVVKQLPVSTLDGMAFRGTVVYQEAIAEPWDDRIYLGTTSGGWSGLYIFYRHSDNSIVVNDSGVFSLDGVKESLTGEELEYYITFDIEGGVVTAGITVNDVKIADYQFPESALTGNYIMLYSKNNNMVFPASGTPIIPNPPNPPEPPTVYTPLSFADFGILDKTYKNVCEGATNAETLDGISITEKITFHALPTSEGQGDIRIAGRSSEIWESPVSLLVSADSQLWTWDNSGCGQSVPIGAITIGQPFELKMEFDYVGIEKTDLQVKFYLNGAEEPNATTLYSGLATEIRPWMIVNGNANQPITIGDLPEPITQATPEELGYMQVRLPDFEIADGTYTPDRVTGNHTYDVYQESDSLNNRYLDVNVAFGGETLLKDNSLRFASGDGWTGVQIAAESEFLWIVDALTGQGYQYTLQELGLETLADEFNLKLGIKTGLMEEAGVCDITFCLWIEDVLVAKDTALTSVTGVGNGLAIYTPSNPITLSSPASVDKDTSGTKKETLPDDFRNVTFGNFDVKDGKYVSTGELVAAGEYILPLDKTLFSGNVYFSAVKGGDFRYGGAANEWCGFHFYSMPDGRIYMNAATPEGLLFEQPYVFKPFTAGCNLVDAWVNIKLTTELVDSDKDGVKDDVKLGVWFADVLYDNTYIYLTDYEPFLGSKLGVYVDKGEGFIQIKSDSAIDTGVDYTLFGFTDNWEKELGLK